MATKSEPKGKAKAQDNGAPAERTVTLDKSEVETFEHTFVLGVPKGVPVDVEEFLSGSVDNASIVATVQFALNQGFRFDTAPIRLDVENDGRGSLRVTYGGPVHPATDPEPGKDPSPSSVIADMGGTTIETEDADSVREEIKRTES